MPLERSAGAVVFRKEDNIYYYLLLHHQAGHWAFPKGNIEKGEKLEETVVREIEEETGIKDIRFIEGFKETIKYFYKRDGKNIFKTVVFFLAETKTKTVKISWEHTDFEWLNFEKALERLTFQNARNVLKKAEQFLRDHKV